MEERSDPPPSSGSPRVSEELNPEIGLIRALAIGIGLLTAGVFVAVMLADATGAGNGVVLLVRGLVTVIGLCVVLYAIIVA